jgi:hypothetical protein
VAPLEALARAAPGVCSRLGRRPPAGQPWKQPEAEALVPTISLYGYLNVVKQTYMVEPEEMTCFRIPSL